jgi:hypothetical protein
VAQRTLSIKNFREHQHYHDDRDVTWIKFYTRLLDDYDFSRLPEVQQAQLLKLWLLAARSKNAIPNDPEFIRSKIGTRGKLYLEELTAAGWLVHSTEDALEPTTEHSRETLEKVYKPSSPRALARGEERREEKRRVRRTRASGASETWLTPLHDAHEAIYGAGSFQPLAGEFAKFWRGLVDAHGAEKCARVWTFSQDCPEKERGFRSPKYVASRFAQFDPDAPGFPEAAA